jgi:hypothetical protein
VRSVIALAAVPIPADDTVDTVTPPLVVMD